jgi:hypothetical protein
MPGIKSAKMFRPMPFAVLGKDAAMKLLISATLVVVCGVATCCFAQEPPAAKLSASNPSTPNPSTPNPSTPKPPILLESKKDSSGFMSENCVDVEIGGDKAPSLGCLNRRLKQQVDTIQPSVNSPPFDAKSQDVRIGIINEAAVRQQFGSSFGKSVAPPRPTIPNGNSVLRR